MHSAQAAEEPAAMTDVVSNPVSTVAGDGNAPTGTGGRTLGRQVTL